MAQHDEEEINMEKYVKEIEDAYEEHKETIPEKVREGYADILCRLRKWRDIQQKGDRDFVFVHKAQVGGVGMIILGPERLRSKKGFGYMIGLHKHPACKMKGVTKIIVALAKEKFRERIQGNKEKFHALVVPTPSVAYARSWWMRDSRM
eukprot:Hpha_TRINITY_DN1170_c0_g1::TRINITY_DN1170_c0_g1_i1::g.113188::m.113188